MRSKSFQIRIPGRWWLLIGLTVIMAAGCAGTPQDPPMPASPASNGAPVGPEARNSMPAAAPKRIRSPEQRLRFEVRQWEGTPHKMGGAGHQGIDCSGFVQRLYRNVFGRHIPRSTSLQVKSGRPVGKDRLRTGDLVFFRLPHKGRHVGIYLGRSEFAHASTSKGVIISSLQDRFWRRSYWTARRYLNPSD
jgi:cell wall-associated NlpC family hydrolase